MKSKEKTWIDIVVIIGLLVVVYILCQPFSRKWEDGLTEMFTGEEGVYARDTDTYYYLRKAREFTENGFGSISVLTERNKDPLRTNNYSTDREKEPMLLSALAAFLWYALRAIGIKVGIYWLVMRFNSIVLALCTIPIYLFLRKRVSRIVSAYAALVAVVSKPFITGSWQGVFDTDTLICFFALVGILCLYESVLCESKKKSVIYSICATIAMIGLYCTWTMYFVYALIAIATTAFGIIVSAVIARRRHIIRENLTPLITMMCWLGLVVTVSHHRLIKIVNSLFFSSKGGEAWPDPASSVAEMQKTPFFAGDSIWDFFGSREDGVINFLGGGIKIIEILFAIGILVTVAIRCIKKGTIRTKNTEGFLFAAIGSWFLGTLIMTFMGVRFFEFFILPCSLVLAFGISAFFDVVQLEKDVERRIVSAGAAALLFSVFVQWEPILAVVLAAITLLVPVFGRKMGKRIIPIMMLIGLVSSQIEYSIFSGTYIMPYISRPVENAMTWIDRNTSKDSVLVSEWGFGYAFQYYSRRRTMCDGGTYNGIFFYWIDTMLTTSDLKLSAGIARMLQGSGVDGTAYAEELCGGKKAAAELIKSILPLSEKGAKEHLKTESDYTEEQICRLLSFTHPKDVPEMYFVLDSYLISYSPVIRIVGSWDFEGENEQEGAVFLGAYSVDAPSEGNAVDCELGIEKTYYGWHAYIYNEEGELRCYLTTPDGDVVECDRMLYVKDGQRIYDQKSNIEREEDDWLGREAILLIEDAGRVSVIVCEDEMVDSALFQLYVFDNQNQTVFTKVYEDAIPERITEEPSSTQRFLGSYKANTFIDCGIRVWKVNFDE